MACSAGKEAAEEAAAPYGCDTRVRSLLMWRWRVGLWRSGQECQAPLAARTKLAVVVETERCCTVLGGRWHLLPMATMHMAVWWASALGTAESPSSKDSVSWELGAGCLEESLQVRRGLRGWLLRRGPGGGGAGTRAEQRRGGRGWRRGPRGPRGDGLPVGGRGGLPRRWPWRWWGSDSNHLLSDGSTRCTTAGLGGDTGRGPCRGGWRGRRCS